MNFSFWLKIRINDLVDHALERGMLALECMVQCDLQKRHAGNGE
jgi:hypothetical protein